jgi:hypothetical protein
MRLITSAIQRSISSSLKSTSMMSPLGNFTFLGKSGIGFGLSHSVDVARTRAWRLDPVSPALGRFLWGNIGLDILGEENVY